MLILYQKSLNNVYFTVLFSLKNCLYLLLFCYLHYYINTMNYHAIFIRHSKLMQYIRIIL